MLRSEESEDLDGPIESLYWNEPADDDKYQCIAREPESIARGSAIAGTE